MLNNKIIHIIGALVAGGAEKFVVDLLIKMKSQNQDVMLLLLSNKKDKAGVVFSKKLEKYNVPYFAGPTSKVGFKSLIWLCKKLRLLKPDFIHLHTPNTELAYYLIGRFYIDPHKLFRTIHSTSVKYGLLTKWAFHRNDIVKSIACGSATYGAYKNSIKGDFEIIQNGVNFDWAIKNETIIKNSKQELNLDENILHYLCVGSMNGISISESVKAQDIIIKSWIESKMGAKCTRLHFIGSGNLYNSFKLLAKADNSIEFHGIRNDVNTWLQACDYFVMPSKYEGLSIAAIEAIATGIDCIFSNIKPFYELDPPYVKWVEKGSQVSLANCLADTLHTQNIINIKKIETFRDKFSINKTTKKYISLYK